MTEIDKFRPCADAVEFRKQFTNFKDAWEACPRGDWMLWIAFKLNVEIRLFTLTKAHCANTVRHLMKDERSINAVDVAIKFGNGKATEEELRSAAAAAYADAAAAYADAAAAYADAAAAAYAAAAYSDAAAAYAAAAYAAAAYSDAAAADAGYPSRIQNQLETADICRKYLTTPVFEKLNIK